MNPYINLGIKCAQQWDPSFNGIPEDVLRAHVLHQKKDKQYGIQDKLHSLAKRMHSVEMRPYSPVRKYLPELSLGAGALLGGGAGYLASNYFNPDSKFKPEHTVMGAGLGAAAGAGVGLLSKYLLLNRDNKEYEKLYKGMPSYWPTVQEVEKMDYDNAKHYYSGDEDPWHRTDHSNAPKYPFN